MLLLQGKRVEWSAWPEAESNCHLSASPGALPAEGRLIIH